MVSSYPEPHLLLHIHSLASILNMHGTALEIHQKFMQNGEDKLFANLLFLFNQDRRKHVGTIEYTEKKFIKCQLAILFNNTCLNENILPSYTNINTHDPPARNERFTIEYRKQLIKRQISLKCEELEDIKLKKTNKYN